MCRCIHVCPCTLIHFTTVLKWYGHSLIDWLSLIVVCLRENDRTFRSNKDEWKIVCAVMFLKSMALKVILYCSNNFGFFCWYISAIRINFIATCMYHASTTKWIHVSVVKSGMKIYLSISTINILIMIKNSKN